MAYFTSNLVIEEIGYERWRIARPFSFHSDLGLIVHVEAGFETELASIPPIARAFVPKMGYWSQAAAVHDVCYWGHRNSVQVGVDSATGEYVDIDREMADKLLKNGCEAKEMEYDIPLYQKRTFTIYAGVLAGGLSSWETKEEKAERLSRNEIDEDFL